jgi:hypothetical protein
MVLWLTMLLLGNGSCSQADARAAAQAIVPAAVTYRVSPLLLAAVVLHESGGTCRNLVKPDGPVVAGARGCAVGPFQIYCPACVPGCVRRFLDRDRAAVAAAKKLAAGRTGCLAGIIARRHVPWYCAIRPFGWANRYNPKSRTWLYNVLTIYRKLWLWSKRHRRIKI